jgi:hypothetical protein
MQRYISGWSFRWCRWPFVMKYSSPIVQGKFLRTRGDAFLSVYIEFDANQGRLAEDVRHWLVDLSRTSRGHPTAIRTRSTPQGSSRRRTGGSHFVRLPSFPGKLPYCLLSPRNYVHIPISSNTQHICHCQARLAQRHPQRIGPFGEQRVHRLFQDQFFLKG